MNKLGRGERAPWNDFSKVIRNGNLGALKNEPEYLEAKEGDLKAALDLVERLIIDDTIEQLKELIGDENPVILPVLAEEETGRNKIPIAFAQELAEQLNLEVETGIIQQSYIRRTDSGADHRLEFNPSFEGEVNTGQKYIVVDDTLTMGGTLASLRGYIENRGGHVIGASVMTAHPGSLDLVVKPNMLAAIEAKHGQTMDKFWKENYGYEIDKLTQGEAGHLKAAKNVDSIRERLSQARDEGIKHLVEKRDQTKETNQKPGLNVNLAGNRLHNTALSIEREQVSLQNSSSVEEAYQHKQGLIMEQNNEDVKEPVITETFDRNIDEAVKRMNATSIEEDNNSVQPPNDETNKETEQKLLPDNIEREYNEINSKFYLRNQPDTLAFVDKGQKLQARLSTAKIAKSLVAIGEKRQWTEIKVNGSKEFKRNIWLAASLKGMDVTGYKPTESELAELKQKSANGVNDISNGKSIDAAKNVEDINKLSGKVVDFGNAPYLNKKENRQSYFVELENEDGNKNKVWGVDLERTIRENKVSIGDTIELENKGRQPVTISKKTTDEQGKTVFKDINTHRNVWEVKAEALKNPNSSPDDIIKEHPELVNEVAAVKVAEKFSQAKIPSQEDQQRFINEVKNILSKDVAQGHTFTTVKIKEEQIAEQQQTKEEASNER